MKRFSKYARERLKALYDGLLNFGDQPNSEQLHQIRLEIKKIKALLNVTEFSVNGFMGHKHYLPFRSIFRRAGEIRQADVLNDLLSIYNIKTKQINDSETQLFNRELISAFQDGLPEFLSTVARKRGKLMHYFKDVNQSSFEEYLRKKNKELKRKLFPRLNQRELHKTRKIIKEIVYLSGIKKKSKQKLDPFYDKLQVLIGQWHDKQIVLTMIDANKYTIELKELKAECRKDINNIKELVLEFYG